MTLKVRRSRSSQTRRSAGSAGGSRAVSMTRLVGDQVIQLPVPGLGLDEEELAEVPAVGPRFGAEGAAPGDHAGETPAGYGDFEVQLRGLPEELQAAEEVETEDGGDVLAGAGPRGDLRGVQLDESLPAGKVEDGVGHGRPELDQVTHSASPLVACVLPCSGRLRAQKKRRALPGACYSVNPFLSMLLPRTVHSKRNHIMWSRGMSSATCGGLWSAEAQRVGLEP